MHADRGGRDRASAGDDAATNKSAVRTMAILNYMAAVRAPVTISEISAALSIPKSSVFNLMHTLAGGRYVEIDDLVRTTFRLGFRLFQTGITYLSNVELHQIAHPMLHSLMHQVGETVHLGTEDEECLVFLDSIEAKGSVVRSVARLGRSESPMYCSGLGKALLAALPDAELVRRYRGVRFDRRTANTIANLPELLEEARMTRERGFALDTMESNDEQFCVACPVYDRSGRVVAAISCSAPSQRISKREQIVESVAKAAVSLSQRLGYLGTRFYAELG